MTVEALVQAVVEEARREPFPIDTPVYEKAGKDPYRPVLHGGTLQSSVAVMGRDLGRDEVVAGQPLIGAGGRLVREGLHRAALGEEPRPGDRALRAILDHVLLTNTVPYKPPGNKAYPGRVKERFRPFVASLLADYWTGSRVITLGNEAFDWFAPYALDPSAFEAFWRRDDRYEAEIEVELSSPRRINPSATKHIVLMPLPHPSPLNARWYGKFPELLARRLATLF